MCPTSLEIERPEAEAPAPDTARQEIIGAFPDFLKLQEEFKEKAKHNERGKLAEYIEAAAMEHKITQYVISHSGDEPFLRDFWDELKAIARQQAGVTAYFFEAWQSGIVGQAATYHVLRACGFDPRIADPREDAKGVDIEITIDEMAQVKVYKNIEEPSLVPTDSVGLPAVHLTFQGEEATFNERIKRAMSYFKVGMRDLAKQRGVPVRGYILMIPRKVEYMNLTTGQPTQKLVDFCRRELKQRWLAPPPLTK